MKLFILHPSTFILCILPVLCFGNETNPASDWGTAFFADRIELALTPPSETGLTLRWTPDGLSPRPTSQPWHGPLSFAETTRFRSQVFKGTERQGELQARNLVRLAAATPAQQAEEGLWTRQSDGQWKTLATPTTLPPGSFTCGVLKVAQSDRYRVVSSPLTRVTLGGFTFGESDQNPGPIWIEAGSYPLSVEHSFNTGIETGSLTLVAHDASGQPPVFLRSSAPPEPLFSSPEKAASAASDGLVGTAWAIPSGEQEQTFALKFVSPVEGALVFVTDPAQRGFPGNLRLPDGKALSAVAVGPGRFQTALTAPLSTLTLVQPTGAPAWPLYEILHIPADSRPFSTVAINCLPGDDATALPELKRLAALVTDLWPRLATATRHDPRSFPRQLWLGCVASQGEPVKVIGRHFLLSREALGKPGTASLLVQKLGELAARPLGSTPPDIAQGLGAGVVLITLGAERSLPGGVSYLLPAAPRAERIALAASANRKAFDRLLESARGTWDVSMWKQFEAAIPDRNPTEK